MEDVLAGRGCSWTFGPESLTITPGPGKAPKLLAELGERVVPYAAISDVTLTRGKRGTVALRAIPRWSADPVLAAAAGQLKEREDPYLLVLPEDKETLADYYAQELRSAVTDRGPADRFLVAPPPTPRAFKAWDGAAAFDGEIVTFTWFWSGASSAKYATGDQRYHLTELEGVEWHAPEGASGSLRLKARGRRTPLDPNKDPASVVFSLGYGATHQSLPFAAAVLAALSSSNESGTPEADEAPRPPEALTAAPHWSEVTELIARLGELRDSGVLSEEEFQAKKTELLSRL
ncbi:DUF4429 domain-containing protein [Nonomuraea sp. NPDC048892]|uniref:DUF4429 domain-containing protein n=1 Tax=Nonomuraea sp. NPDC048892 TaxID=3154624 RepID=UPI000A6A44EE